MSIWPQAFLAFQKFKSQTDLVRTVRSPKGLPSFKSHIVPITKKEKKRIYHNTASFDVYLWKNFPQEIEEAYLRLSTKNFCRLVWAM